MSSQAAVVRVNVDPCKHFLGKYPKFKKNVTRFYPKDPRKHPLVMEHLVAGDNVCLVVLLNSKSLDNRRHQLIDDIRYLNHHFSSVQGVSKTLLVTFLRRPYGKYKNLLQTIPQGNRYLFNVNVLEIAVGRGSVKLFNLDHFRGILRGISGNNVKFFADPMNNLHGFKLKMMPFYQPNVTKNSHAKYFLNLIFERPVETAVMLLNASRSLVFDKKWRGRCFSQTSHQSLWNTRMEIERTFAAPAKKYDAYYIVPALYDEITEDCYSGLLLNSLALLLIVAYYQLSKKFFHLDPETLSLLSTFSMIIGIGNPRGAVRFGETLAFTLLMALGFFVGSDLIFGLLSVSIVTKVERRLMSVDEIGQNGISFVYFRKHEKQALQNFPNVKWAERSDVGHGTNMFQHMLVDKNESVPSFLELYNMPFPDKIAINGQVYARKSNVKNAYSLVLKWFLPRNCPWLHHFNCHLLRYYENHMGNTREVCHFRGRLVNTLIRDPINLVVSGLNQDLESQSVELGDFWMFIATSCALSFVVLQVEIFLFKLGNRC